MKYLALLFTYLFLITSFAGGENLFILVPSETIPGETISVTGVPFPDGIRVILGDNDIVPTYEKPDRLRFIVPQLPPGDYTLTLTKNGTLYGSTEKLRITEPVPRIISLSPTNIDECPTAGEAAVSIDIEGFLPGGYILVDGKTVPF